MSARTSSKRGLAHLDVPWWSSSDGSTVYRHLIVSTGLAFWRQLKTHALMHSRSFQIPTTPAKPEHFVP